MPSSFTKQLQQISQAGAGSLNGGAGDLVIGGTLTGVPSGTQATQGIQDIPGDRIVFGMMDALALSNTSIGTLYGGMYQYVTSYLSAVATPTIKRGVFWRTASADNSYTVTPDESGTQGANFMAGVCINTLTSGNSWWIQISGKATLLFRATLTGVPEAGCGVFASNAGAGADVGTFDVLSGLGANPTFAQFSTYLNLYVGPAGAAPTAATASVVEMDLKHIRY